MDNEAPYKRLISAMNEQSEKDKIFFAKVLKIFEELNLHNSIYAEELAKLATVLTSYSINTFEDPASELELDRDRGMSINIGTALRALGNYATPLRDGGEQDSDLDMALISIFREKERRIINSL